MLLVVMLVAVSVIKRLLRVPCRWLWRLVVKSRLMRIRSVVMIMVRVSVFLALMRVRRRLVRASILMILMNLTSWVRFTLVLRVLSICVFARLLLTFLRLRFRLARRALRVLRMRWLIRLVIPLRIGMLRLFRVTLFVVRVTLPRRRPLRMK